MNISAMQLACTTSYFDHPSFFDLAPDPKLSLLRTKALKLDSVELRSTNVNYVLADRKSDEVKIIMHRGVFENAEYLEVFCPPSLVGPQVPTYSGLNLWSDMCKWVFKRQCQNEPISMIFAFEDHFGGSDLPKNFNTYVDFLKPNLVIVTEGDTKSKTHDKLKTVYSDCFRAELRGGGDNVLYFYYNRNVLTVKGAMEAGYGFVNVQRAHGEGSNSALK